MFHSYNLFPHLTVKKNITLVPCAARGKSRAAALQLANTVLRQVGLSDMALTHSEQLSGGQQQRVAIALSLAMVLQAPRWHLP